MANIGLGQVRSGGDREKPLITSGSDVANVSRFLEKGVLSYSAKDVIQYLLSGVRAPVVATS
jgi:hypothetical protein